MGAISPGHLRALCFEAGEDAIHGARERERRGGEDLAENERDEATGALLKGVEVLGLSQPETEA